MKLCQTWGKALEVTSWTPRAVSWLLGTKCNCLLVFRGAVSEEREPLDGAHWSPYGSLLLTQMLHRDRKVALLNPSVIWKVAPSERATPQCAERSWTNGFGVELRTLHWHSSLQGETCCENREPRTQHWNCGYETRGSGVFSHKTGNYMLTFSSSERNSISQKHCYLHSKLGAARYQAVCFTCPQQSRLGISSMDLRAKQDFFPFVPSTSIQWTTCKFFKCNSILNSE